MRILAKKIEIKASRTREATSKYNWDGLMDGEQYFFSSVAIPAVYKVGKDGKPVLGKDGKPVELEPEQPADYSCKDSSFQLMAKSAGYKRGKYIATVKVSDPSIGYGIVIQALRDATPEEIATDKERRKKAKESMKVTAAGNRAAKKLGLDYETYKQLLVEAEKNNMSVPEYQAAMALASETVTA